jgi:hypothetical protein
LTVLFWFEYFEKVLKKFERGLAFKVPQKREEDTITYTMCARNVAPAEEDMLAIQCRTPGGIMGSPVVAGDDPYTAMIRSLLYLFDCYDEDSGEYQKPNLTRVELHTRLWFVDNVGGDTELLRSLIGTVMEYDPMFVVQVLALEEKGNWFRQHRGFVAWHRPQFEESEGTPPGSFLDDRSSNSVTFSNLLLFLGGSFSFTEIFSIFWFHSSSFWADRNHSCRIPCFEMFGSMI